MDNIKIDNIMELLRHLNDEVQKVHGGDDDDLGAIVWNDCLAIAGELGRDM